jgi:hypothetical protein
VAAIATIGVRINNKLILASRVAYSLHMAIVYQCSQLLVVITGRGTYDGRQRNYAI